MKAKMLSRNCQRGSTGVFPKQCIIKDFHFNERNFFLFIPVQWEEYPEIIIFKKRHPDFCGTWTNTDALAQEFL